MPFATIGFGAWFWSRREDVQCMAYETASNMLATGDYGGRICIWNIFTRERRHMLSHEAPEYQRSLEKLLFLRPHGPRALLMLLSCGGMSTQPGLHYHDTVRGCTSGVAVRVGAHRPPSTMCMTMLLLLLMMMMMIMLMLILLQVMVASVCGE